MNMNLPNITHAKSPIEIKLTDNKRNRTVKKARVIVYDNKAGSSKIYNCLADENGTAIISLSKPGVYRMEVRADDYRTIQQDIEILEATTTTTMVGVPQSGASYGTTNTTTTTIICTTTEATLPHISRTSIQTTTTRETTTTTTEVTTTTIAEDLNSITGMVTGYDKKTDENKITGNAVAYDDTSAKGYVILMSALILVGLLLTYFIYKG
jgi:hypothetical protein